MEAGDERRRALPGAGLAGYPRTRCPGAAGMRRTLQQAAAWTAVRNEGAEWRVLPLRRPELWPNMKSDQDGPWHDAKAKVGAALADLTILPRVNATHRARAHELGVTRWDDPRVSSELLGISSEKEAAIVDAVLAVNRPGVETVRPERMTRSTQIWRQRAPVEAFVDFESSGPQQTTSRPARSKAGSRYLPIGSGTYQEVCKSSSSRAATLAAEATISILARAPERRWPRGGVRMGPALGTGRRGNRATSSAVRQREGTPSEVSGRADWSISARGGQAEPSSCAAGSVLLKHRRGHCCARQSRRTGGRARGRRSRNGRR